MGPRQSMMFEKVSNLLVGDLVEIPIPPADGSKLIRDG
jgi:hypothetical protein